MRKLVMALLLLCFTFAVSAQIVTGELKRWHKVTLTFDGPETSENAKVNPFLNYNLEVIFTNGKLSYTVLGYYSGCDNPAESSCTTGNKWKVHFAPGKTGNWQWKASFKTGNKVAVNGGGKSAGFMDGDSGSIAIEESNKSGRDHRAKNKGRLQYVGEHYLRYSGTNPEKPNGAWFIKGGADSPENALAYEDFDHTPNRGDRRKSWKPHQRDYSASDASAYTWKKGKGSEMLGMIKYLSDKGLNAFSFLTFSLQGDDENVFPHLLKVSEKAYNKLNNKQQWNKGVHKDRFDISKMAQWEKIFEYGDKKGMFMHFKTLETENDNIMDNNTNGTHRKLYYRELIARFGHHLALNWNLSEESTIPTDVVKSMASYIKNLDPYEHHVVLHTYPHAREKYYTPLLGNKSKLTGVSIQTNNLDIHGVIKKWVNESKKSKKKWVVSCDEPGNAQIGIDADPKDITLVRDQVLWATLMAGGMGVEYYYGYKTGQTDLNAENHRSREKKYTDVSNAIAFFSNYLQSSITSMISSDGVTADKKDRVFAKAGEVYVVYRPKGGKTKISLSGANDSYKVQWYNPRSGGALSAPKTMNTDLVAPSNKDWVALITKKGDVISTPTIPISTLIPPTLGCVAIAKNGVIAVEAEHFESQSKTEKRKWYVFDKNNTSGPKPDKDASHHTSASNGGYLEILPDTRVTHSDRLIAGENFSNDPGVLTIVNYKVKFPSAGKYFVWVRVYSTGAEDNGVHVGLNGKWPDSGKKMQWCSGKQKWTWESRQRTNANHCGEERKIFLNVPSAGVHTVSFSLREDGFEMDKFILSKEYTKPSGAGQEEILENCESNPPTPTPTPVPPTISGNQTKEVILSPIHDAYLQGSKRYNKNVVRIEKNKRTGYLLFDLSTIQGTVTKADLTFTITEDPGDGELTVHKGTSSAWTETNLSNKNKPKTLELIGSSKGTFDINNSKTVSLEPASISGNRLSLILDAKSGNDFAFASKENKSVNKPKLVITYITKANKERTKEGLTFTVFPNPANDRITIQGIEKVKQIAIYNMLGKVVRTIHNKNGVNQQEIAIGELPSGMYFVRALDFEATAQQIKFIKK